MQITIDLIERDFIARRLRPPDMAGAFATAFAQVAAGVDDAACLAALGLALVSAIDGMAARLAEPAYHNRHHMAETTLAMAMLCRLAQQQGLLSAHQAAIGVVAMLGHDMGHDGSMPGPGLMEEQTRRAVAAFAQQAGVAAPVIAALVDVIMATDATRFADNAARLAGLLPPGPLGRGQDALRALANEADICGSLLPRLGPRLSRALATEWRAAGDPTLATAGTATSRLTFLRACPPFSAPATSLGLEAARARCLAAWATAGRRLGTDPTPEAGCAALDRLDPSTAAALYCAAVADSARR